MILKLTSPKRNFRTAIGLSVAISILFLLPILSFSQTQNISGSVFYKYNEFVGNRPDAGSAVIIFPLKNPKDKIESSVELQGDFTISNLDTGQHLVIIKSKETKANPYITYSKLLVYSKRINKYFDFNIKEISPILQDQIEQKNNELLAYMTSEKAKSKKIAEMRMEVIELVFKFFSLIPIEKLIEMRLSLPTENIHIEELRVPASKKIIVDFGISYM